tara:strand:- start:296 stop:418 length:123 start_codon:yes stop_codon:yes gene_type:complete
MDKSDNNVIQRRPNAVATVIKILVFGGDGGGDGGDEVRCS